MYSLLILNSALQFKTIPIFKEKTVFPSKVSFCTTHFAPSYASLKDYLSISLNIDKHFQNLANSKKWLYFLKFLNSYCGKKGAYIQDFFPIVCNVPKSSPTSSNRNTQKVELKKRCFSLKDCLNRYLLLWLLTLS